MLMMKKPKNLEFEPMHPKNVLLASVVHGISRLLFLLFGILIIFPCISIARVSPLHLWTVVRNYAETELCEICRIQIFQVQSQEMGSKRSN
jgi:hypothetical protein